VNQVASFSFFGQYLDNAKSRNPFVNQVASFGKRARDCLPEQSRNPFVNQVASFEKVVKYNDDYVYASQSLRESGRFVLQIENHVPDILVTQSNDVAIPS